MREITLEFDEKSRLLHYPDGSVAGQLGDVELGLCRTLWVAAQWDRTLVFSATVSAAISTEELLRVAREGLEERERQRHRHVGIAHPIRGDVWCVCGAHYDGEDWDSPDDYAGRTQ